MFSKLYCIASMLFFTFMDSVWGWGVGDGNSAGRLNKAPGSTQSHQPTTLPQQNIASDSFPSVFLELSILSTPTPTPHPRAYRAESEDKGSGCPSGCINSKPGLQPRRSEANQDPPEAELGHFPFPFLTRIVLRLLVSFPGPEEVRPEGRMRDTVLNGNVRTSPSLLGAPGRRLSHQADSETPKVPSFLPRPPG